MMLTNLNLFPCVQVAAVIKYNKNLMQSKQPQTKSYSYHFTKIIPNAPQSTSAVLNEPFSPVNTPKNVNINFRYHTEGQESDKRGPYLKRESLRVQNCPEKCSEPAKRYTFSLLASEARQRAIENKQSLSVHLQNAQRDLLREAGTKRAKAEANLENSVLKKPVKITANSAVERRPAKEAQKEAEIKENIEKQLVDLRVKNQDLQVRLRELERQIAVRDSQIVYFEQEIDVLKKQRGAMGGVVGKLQLCSNLWGWQVEESEQSFEKENKEWSTSTITYNYEEEYKQVLAVFEIQISEENFHDRLLTHIQRLFKRVEQLAKSSALCRQRQKENARLSHHLRRLQGENVHLTNMAALLGKEREKVIELLAFTNGQVQRLSFKMLDMKYGALNKE